MPVLGLCLGGQLLAHVTGGQVTAKSGETERGMRPLTVLPAAVDDPIFGRLPGVPDEPLWMIENHEDSVTALPPSAHAAGHQRGLPPSRRSAWATRGLGPAVPPRGATGAHGDLGRGGAVASWVSTGRRWPRRRWPDAVENEAQARALVRAWADVVLEAAR